MNMQEKMLSAEERILDLEITRRKAKCSKRQQVIIKPKLALRSSEPPWAMRITNLPGGRKKYERRNAVGVWSALPENRQLWPEEFRTAETQFEQIDARRARSGHLQATLGNCELSDF